MKVPQSKSILSPGRHREQHPHASSSSQISLSTSLSRRLRNSGSLKGGQASPLFSRAGGGGGKRKGGAFESPEPSSPKVTCIGQVRIKSKKHARKKMAQFGSRNGGNQSCVDRNVKWVHFPSTICEGLSCFIPCRSGFCGSGEKGGSSNSETRSAECCGSVFARWVVDDRKIAVVVGEEEQGRVREMVEDSDEDGCRRTRRRNLFQEIEFKDASALAGDGGRVSICIPPKNALLLMRCRSDPVKMAAMANRFFEAPPEVEDEDGSVPSNMDVDLQKERNEKIVDEEDDAEQEVACVVEEPVSEEPCEPTMQNEEKDDEKEKEEEEEEAERQTEAEPEVDQGMINSEEETKLKDDTESKSEIEEGISEPKTLPDCLLLMMCEPKLSMEVSKETWVRSADFIRWVPGGRSKLPSKKADTGEEPDSRKRASPSRDSVGASASSLQADEEEKSKAIRGRSSFEKPWKLQPPRSSCHYPQQQSMASAIEKKLVAYEPYVLTRCKSEPMRTAAAKLAPPDTCPRNNRKIEPPPASPGCGSAGVGCQ